MRIIAGTNKGMKLLPPKGNDTRPITDRVKESLFSILYTKGMLDERYWRGKAKEILVFLEDEAWQKQWRMGRDLFDPDFAEWLGRAIEDRYGG